MIDPTAPAITARPATAVADPAVGRAANWFGAAFYASVAVLALAGQTGAAMSWLGWPPVFALPAVAVVELGGIALAARADFRRRLGERALAARVLSAAVATFAVTFNWLGHGDHLAGGFFAGMSGLGYAVWLINSADRRRDQLRAERKLAPTPPAYGLAQWLRHPWITRRARALAKADAGLGLYGSLVKAQTQLRTERRNAALARALRRRIAAAVDPTMAEIAVLTYDLDEIAARLRATADYDGLTGLLAADLTADRVAAAGAAPAPAGRWGGRRAFADAAPGNGATGHTGPAPRRLAAPAAALPAVGVDALTRQSAGVSPPPLPASANGGSAQRAGVSAPRATLDKAANGGDSQVSRVGERQPAVREGRQRAASAPRLATAAGAARQPAHAPAPRREVANAEEARQRYLVSAAAGQPLTGRQLGALYDRSPAWGRERIGEAKKASAASAPLPAVAGDISAGARREHAHRR